MDPQIPINILDTVHTDLLLPRSLRDDPNKRVLGLGLTCAGYQSSEHALNVDLFLDSGRMTRSGVIRTSERDLTRRGRVPD
jgi:hypothetical protein